MNRHLRAGNVKDEAAPMPSYIMEFVDPNGMAYYLPMPVRKTRKNKELMRNPQTWPACYEAVYHKKSQAFMDPMEYQPGSQLHKGQYGTCWVVRSEVTEYGILADGFHCCLHFSSLHNNDQDDKYECARKRCFHYHCAPGSVHARLPCVAKNVHEHNSDSMLEFKCHHSVNLSLMSKPKNRRPTFTFTEDHNKRIKEINDEAIKCAEDIEKDATRERFRHQMAQDRLQRSINAIKMYNPMEEMKQERRDRRLQLAYKRPREEPEPRPKPQRPADHCQERIDYYERMLEVEGSAPMRQKYLARLRKYKALQIEMASDDDYGGLD